MYTSEKPREGTVEHAAMEKGGIFYVAWMLECNACFLILIVSHNNALLASVNDNSSLKAASSAIVIFFSVCHEYVWVEEL